MPKAGILDTIQCEGFCSTAIGPGNVNRGNGVQTNVGNGSGNANTCTNFLELSEGKALSSTSTGEGSYTFIINGSTIQPATAIGIAETDHDIAHARIGTEVNRSGAPV